MEELPHPEESKSIIVINEDNEAIVITARELDISNTDVLRTLIFDAIHSEEVARVIIDLRDTKMLDATALGVFVGAHNKSRCSQKELSIRNMERKIYKIFEIVGLNTKFDIEGFEED